MGPCWEVPLPTSPRLHGQLIRQLFKRHIWEFVQHSLNTFRNIHQVGTLLWFKFVTTCITHNMPQPPMHSFSQVLPNIKWMVNPPTLGISCAFTWMIPFLDGIPINLLCPSMNTLLWVMNSIPKMHFIPPKVETNKSTFLSNSLVEEACLLLAMWLNGEPHLQSAPQWVPWILPIGVLLFQHYLGLRNCGKSLCPKDITPIA
jgi:hypothetical protein